MSSSDPSAPPLPKALVLDLLSSLRGKSMPVRALVAAGELFGIAENSLRVALARLRSRGLVESNSRGCYRLSSGAGPVQRQVTSWSELESAQRWSGAWVGVHTAGLGRTRRTELRARERALTLLGFRPLESELWVRPDSLDGGLDELRGRLRGLGLPDAAPVFRMDELDAATDARARELWNGEQLRAGYERLRQELVESERRLETLDANDAMVESFLVGGRAIAQLAYDPRLPAPIGPVAERRELVRALRRYDRIGRTLWSRFMRAHDAPYRQAVIDLDHHLPTHAGVAS